MKDRIIALLTLIAYGDIKLQLKNPEETWESVYAGNVKYVTTDGVNITIFNDCNSFDYIDTIVFVDGEIYDYEDNRKLHYDTTLTTWVDTWMYDNPELADKLINYFINAR